ncbi:hypothetical protein K0M31_003697 [Melipona bicolor]|uniref:Uncharacterized protein n=1 Tax=Melipona bicolor TaxID=60889 RepID=A0AA40FXD6_9HYME|nr:hypothetical protein K0M31_003697 [Melipona bicolor]
MNTWCMVTVSEYGTLCLDYGPEASSVSINRNEEERKASGRSITRDIIKSNTGTETISRAYKGGNATQGSCDTAANNGRSDTGNDNAWWPKCTLETPNCRFLLKHHLCLPRYSIHFEGKRGHQRGCRRYPEGASDFRPQQIGQVHALSIINVPLGFTSASNEP